MIVFDASTLVSAATEPYRPLSCRPGVNLRRNCAADSTGTGRHSPARSLSPVINASTPVLIASRMKTTSLRSRQASGNHGPCSGNWAVSAKGK